MARVTQKRISRVVQTARQTFEVEIPDAVARQIIAWDDEQMFVAELSDDGTLDTASEDYFGMALIAAVMPGKPTVHDELISRPLERWHFPLNGSSDDYCRAFLKAWRAAVRKLNREARDANSNR